jgi:outer membrane protein assembly factor BamA
LRNKTTKIALFILLGFAFYSCSLTKRVPQDKHLLMKTDILVNGETKNEDVLKDQLYQLPNTNILGYRLRLHLFNLAKPDADSAYKAWLERKPGRHERLTRLLSEKQVQRLGNSFVVSGFSNFLKRTGEPPSIIDINRIKKSRNRLSAYYYKRGYFRNKVGFKVDTVGLKRAEITYDIITGKPYIIDSLNAYIETPALDSLYNLTKNESLIKPREQYDESNFAGERERLTSFFKNRGAYRFQQNFIRYVVDTVTTPYKANVDLIIDNETIRRGDSTVVRPFKLYKLSQVNIKIANPNAEGQELDTVDYNGFKLISPGKLNYRPKAITDAVFMTPGSMYSDLRRTLTYRYVNNLKVFFYPGIQFVEDTTDVTGSSLIANIELKPRKTYKYNMSADFTHSNIQDFGIQGSVGLSIRNVFKGAEILDLSVRGNIGSSRDLAIQDKSFFNISEYGADAKLSFPRIFFPINTERIIPKNTIPTTLLSLGVSRQRNIGLDKENFTGILSYNWNPRRPNRTISAKYDLFNIQYIKNVNAGAYFRVYESSYNRLNEIARAYQSQVNPEYFDSNNNLTIDQGGATDFIADVRGDRIALSEEDRQNVDRIEERRRRLTENNLIFSSNVTYTISTRQNPADNTFFIFKTKLESAGNTLGLISSLTNNENRSASGHRTIFDVEYSQYGKAEFDLIKHFDLRRGTILAMRAFAGIAVPYGNSTSIPFTRSYFAGGSNDNRAWQSYRLGPGRSGGRNDFNEANFKLAYSAELRFNLFGKLNGAVFGDLGNIWNVFDEVDHPDFTFNGFSSFRDLALGTGFGFRYDFSFFVVRFDVGFKTYNPGRPEGDRWFKEYNFSNSVLNVGINYPF